MISNVTINDSENQTTPITEFQPTEPNITAVSSVILNNSNDKYFNNESIIELLKTINYDINGCLVNCSNNGVCKLNKYNKYECSCISNYSGLSCQINIRPCSQNNHCLNSGTCVDTMEFDGNTKKDYFSYKCLCSDRYYGSNCEYEVDLCQNNTCSSKGYCKYNISKSNGSECECFKYYSGSNCEFVSNEFKTIVVVVRASSIIAIIFICLIYVILIGNDILNSRNEFENSDKREQSKKGQK